MSAATGIKKISFWILPSAIALFLLLFFCTYPYYRYFIDPDATSYITIAKRYATGDYSRAVNGMWSPFSPWLVALTMKCGAGAIAASHYVNALAGICNLVAAFILFRRFSIERFLGSVMLLSLPFFFIYALYYQLFDDLWQLFFLLCYLMLVTSRGFLHRPLRWLACGVVAAFAYFAKTYSFYFILLHLAATLYILVRKEDRKLPAIVKPLSVVLITMLVVMSPWLFALHQKYGKWGISIVGPIDISWSLTGHKTFKPGIRYLIPPSYPDSPGNMEDPWINEGKIYSLWDDPKFLITEAGRSLHASVQFVKATGEISIFLLTILSITALFIFFKQDQLLFDTRHRILLWASLLLPLGYLAMHVEARFIWLLGFTAIVFGATWLNELRERVFGQKGYVIAVLLLAFSYIAYPVYDMKQLFNKGKDLYMEAEQIKGLGLKGSFTSNDLPTRGPTTAFLTGIPYYTIEATHVPHKDLLEEMRRYRVNYYFFYYLPSEGMAIDFKDDRDASFPELTGGTIPGLKIFQVNRF